ncbi:GNAT family N-acetyltransferase [Daejeonella sp.]|uniref:GNAT family N-acetyltransferase n=1 Tax=Daejeonella sp. TaxID=2805397 RepID=UPI003982FEE0
MEIIEATEGDIPVIHELAEKIWWPTYRPILSEEQISFMLKNMYSESALKKQLNAGVKFLLVKRESENVAFAGYSLEYSPYSSLKIHKIYVLPMEQGKGTGKALIDYISQLARDVNIKELELNVNRANPALQFYQKIGFEIKETVDIPYHQFVLNDYVMRKKFF